MVEENESSKSGGTGGGSSQGWSEGGPVESMTPDVARAEIKAIEADQNFAGDGQMPHWDRQRMLKRRDALYRHAAGPEGDKPYSGMEQTLREQGVTKESLDRDQQKFQDRDKQGAEDKTIQALEAHWGKEGTPEKIKLAQSVVKKYITNSKDLEFLDKSDLGNDPETIQIFARLGEILDGARKRMGKTKANGDYGERTELTRRGGKK